MDASSLNGGKAVKYFNLNIETRLK